MPEKWLFKKLKWLFKMIKMTKATCWHDYLKWLWWLKLLVDVEILI
jgi:hypothetical protein